MDKMILKPTDILLVVLVAILPVSVGLIWDSIDESDAEPEEFECPYPYIIDEQGRFRLVATVTVTMSIHTGISNGSPLKDSDFSNS